MKIQTRRAVIGCLALGLSLVGAHRASALTLSDFAIYAVDSVQLGTETQVFCGMVGSEKDLTITADAYVPDGMRALRHIQIGTDADVDQDVVGGGNVSINADAIITGNVDAGGNLQLGTNAKVLGNVTAGGFVSTNAGSNITGNVLADGNVSLGTGSQVDGNVGANGNISLNANAKILGTATRTGSLSLGGGASVGASVVGPSVVSPATFTPLSPLPTATVFTPSALAIDDVGGAANTVLNLAPGTYRNLSLGNTSDLYLSAGDYVFNKFSATSGLDLFLDFTGGPINLFVKDTMSIGTGSEIFIYDSGSASYKSLADSLAADPTLINKFYAEVHKGFSQNADGQWLGKLYTPFDYDIGFGTNSTIEGQLISGGKVTINADSTINSLSCCTHEPDPCAGPNPPPDCDGGPNTDPNGIPEPVTASLSLLSLAGLFHATHRRRTM